MGNPVDRKRPDHPFYSKRNWFSRRHETAESSREMREAHPYTGGHKSRKARAEARNG